MIELRLHFYKPGAGERALDELKRALPDSKHAPDSGGYIQSEIADADAAGTPCLAFTSQTLPDAEPVSAPSVARWADLVAQKTIERLATHQGPWRLHFFAHDSIHGSSVSRRCTLIDEAVVDRLRRKQRRLARTRVNADAAWTDGDALVQVCLKSPEAGFLSCCLAPQRLLLRRCLSRTPGGLIDVQRDRAPPSRAYLKLLEAEARLGRAIKPGQTCVDLGASPGGWTYVALQQGATVLAVDRSPLRADLMKHPKLIFKKGDAFGYAGEEVVDWLLCDVIAFPERTLKLVEHWIVSRRCRAFVVTMKFRGTSDYPLIADLVQRLERSGAEFWVRQLDHNKNEVTAFGFRDACAAPASDTRIGE